MAYNGTALNSSGKLRLILTATTTGISKVLVMDENRLRETLLRARETSPLWSWIFVSTSPHNLNRKQPPKFFGAEEELACFFYHFIVAEGQAIWPPGTCAICWGTTIRWRSVQFQLEMMTTKASLTVGHIAALPRR